MSDTIQRRARPGESYAVMSEVFTFLTTTQQSDDRLVVVAGKIPPGGSGTGLLHTHEPDEVFHVVRGQLTVLWGELGAVERVDLRDGQTAHVAGHVPHLFRNQSDGVTDVIFTYSPGALIEHFFVAAGVPVADPSAAPEINLEKEIPRVTELAKALGMRFLDEPQSLEG
jgi:mannose-6-phosphate isomerase-like protein (cupin superfamily)